MAREAGREYPWSELVRPIVTFRLCLTACMIALAGPIRGEVVLQDDFSNLSQWQDLSTAVTWSGGGSVFQTMGGVARLTALGGDVSGYTTASSLKTFTALDHRFAKPINRTLQTDSISVTVGGPDGCIYVNPCK